MLCDDLIRLSEARKVKYFETAMPYVRRIGGMLRSAERFIVDNEAIEVAYNVQDTKPSTVLKALGIAKLPFKRMWIEYDARFRNEIQAKYGYPRGVGMSGRAGILIEATDETMVRGRMWAAEQKEHVIVVNPICMDFDLHPDAADNVILRRYQPTPGHPGAYCHSVDTDVFGRVVVSVPALPAVNGYTSRLTVEEKQNLQYLTRMFAFDIERDAQSFATWLCTDKGGFNNSTFTALLQEWDADKRFLIAILIMLNSRNLLEVRERSVREQNRGRSPRAFPAIVSHHHVKIRLSKVTEQRMHMRGLSTRDVPWHKVRGHWKVRATGVFFWMPHTRGNPAVGAVEKDYTIAV